MGLKKLGAALFVCTAVSAVLAGSALAAATTTDVKWYTGALPGTELTGPEAVSAESVGSVTWDFELFGVEVSLQVNGLECVGCKIENSGGTAIGSGKLKFTGVTVEKPANCTTESSITTKALSWRADWMIGTTNYWRIEPTAGEETGFATIEFGGASCLVSGTFIPKGSVFVRSANATGTQSTPQQVSSSAAINSEAGGVLHVGTGPSSLRATVNFKFSGTKAGTAFGTH